MSGMSFGEKSYGAVGGLNQTTIEGKTSQLESSMIKNLLSTPSSKKSGSNYDHGDSEDQVTK